MAIEVLEYYILLLLPEFSHHRSYNYLPELNILRLFLQMLAIFYRILIQFNQILISSCKAVIFIQFCFQNNTV